MQADQVVGRLDQLMSNQRAEPIFPQEVELIVVKCKILRFSKQLLIINKLSFIFLIIYSSLHPITDRLGTVFAQPQLDFSVPHGSRSSISELQAQFQPHSARPKAPVTLKDSQPPWGLMLGCVCGTLYEVRCSLQTSRIRKKLLKGKHLC